MKKWNEINLVCQKECMNWYYYNFIVGYLSVSQCDSSHAERFWRSWIVKVQFEFQADDPSGLATNFNYFQRPMIWIKPQGFLI